MKDFKGSKNNLKSPSSNKINSKGGTQNSNMLKAQWKYVPTT
jgi:hypothetical protein